MAQRSAATVAEQKSSAIIKLDSLLKRFPNTANDLKLAIKDCNDTLESLFDNLVAELSRKQKTMDVDIESIIDSKMTLLENRILDQIKELKTSISSKTYASALISSETPANSGHIEKYFSYSSAKLWSTLLQPRKYF
jgi:hypothetical protein